MRFFRFPVHLRMCVFWAIIWRCKWARVRIVVKELFTISHYDTASFLLKEMNQLKLTTNKNNLSVRSGMGDRSILITQKYQKHACWKPASVPVGEC